MEVDPQDCEAPAHTARSADTAKPILLSRYCEVLPPYTARSADTAKPILRSRYCEALPPYLASTLWMQGKVGPTSLKTRDFTRTIIESNSPGGMVLTVPVVGGSSAAKRLKPECLEISDHGDWTRIHLGAIEAAYGREPYFQHLFPEITQVIDHYPQHLAHLSVLLMRKMMDFIGYADAIEGIEKLRDTNPARFKEIATRLESKINPHHSFLEPLFRLGPDAIFLIMESRLSSLRPMEASMGGRFPNLPAKAISSES